MLDFNENNNKIFAVLSLGCRVNRSEVDDYSAFLLANSWKMANVSSACLIIVNTCTVTSVADKKTRQAVRKLCRDNNNKDCLIYITGCAAAMNASLYEQIDKRINVIPKANMIAELEVLCNHKDWRLLDIGNIVSGDQFRTRASIKIQDGCDNACTYCIVHTARGKSISEDHELIEKRFVSMLKSGIKEVVLTGVNLGAYDDNGISLTELCRRLVQIIHENCGDDVEVPARLRLSSVEPQNVSDELIEFMAKSNGLVCRHLHLPLQSGSTKVLREMDRHYDVKDYLGLVAKMRTKMPSLSFSTDIIVGFPGETDADFVQTLDVAEKCGFMKIHVFPYSIREGTPAAARNDQISAEIKNERAFKLRKLSAELAFQDFKSRAGTFEFAICEKSGIARLESYHTIEVDKSWQVGDLKEFAI